MEPIGDALKERFEQIIIENQMLRAGFAALPYMVLRDTRLSVGARLAYAVLLMYAWQEGATFAGQDKMAKDMGISERHLRRYLNELEDLGYVHIKRQGLNKPNLYYILDVKSKLRRSKIKAERTRVSDQERTRVSL
jgi:transcription initiation factor IIE alpha subunit